MSNPTNPAAVQAMSDEPCPQAIKHEPKDYKGRIKPIWCPGCGNFGVLNALTHALAELNINPDQLAIVSGIGCSSRMPGFVRSYGFHGVHGRALPVAVGVKMGNPRLTVVVVGGDGDGLSIGAGHLPHAARRNVDITYLMLDNRIYGLTKGQTSPTTPSGWPTKTAPQGVIETPMNPTVLSICYGATFVARGYSTQMPQLSALIAAAIRHKGFSSVQILTPCVTFGKGSGYDYFNAHVTPLPDDYDPTDQVRAYAFASNEEKLYAGILYRHEREEYLSTLRRIGAARGRELDDSAPAIDIGALIRRFS